MCIRDRFIRYKRVCLSFSHKLWPKFGNRWISRIGSLRFWWNSVQRKALTRTICSREIFSKKCRQQQNFDSDPKEAWHYNYVKFTPIAKNFMPYCRMIYFFFTSESKIVEEVEKKPGRSSKDTLSRRKMQLLFCKRADIFPIFLWHFFQNSTASHIRRHYF